MDMTASRLRRKMFESNEESAGVGFSRLPDQGKAQSMAALSKNHHVLVWLGIILFAGLLSVNSIAYLVSRDAIRAGISQQALPLTADNVYSDIQKDLLQPVFISSMMAHDTFVRDWILGGERDTSRIANYLAKVRDTYGVNTTFLVSERSRTHYLPTGILKAVSPANDRDRWYFHVGQMREEHEINMDLDEAFQDRITIFVNFKMFGDNGDYLGVTGVGLTLDRIAQHIRHYEDAYHRRIYLLDKTGKLVLSGKSISGLGGPIKNLPGIDLLAKQVMASGVLPSRLQYAGDKSLVLVNSRYIPELSCYLVVEQSEDDDIAEIKSTYLFNLALSLLLSLVVLGLAHLVISRYQARIETLAREALDHAARESELARSQQAFVAMVTHEFSMPLAIIGMSLHGLKCQDADMSPSTWARWGKIARATLRLRALMENFLTEDRLQHADRVPPFEPVALFPLVARSAHRAEWPGMVVTMNEAPVTVRGDRELLRIAFSNIINNAVKYSPEGGVIRVEGCRDGAFVEVRVTDKGVGISPEELHRIFEKYYRATENRAIGSGLGLHLVMQIVELHGGTVTVESEPGSGTCFIVRLPLAE